MTLKIMKSALILVAILGSSLRPLRVIASESRGTCSTRVIQLKGDRLAAQVITRATYNAAAKALDHYRNTYQAEPRIAFYSAYYTLKYGQISGYRFTLAPKGRARVDGAPFVSYYADGNKKLVYATQRTPKKLYWFCE